MKGDHFSSPCHYFFDECNLAITSFIGAIGDDDASSAQINELMQDLTTMMALSTQEAEDRVVGEQGTNSVTEEGISHDKA